MEGDSPSLITVTLRRLDVVSLRRASPPQPARGRESIFATCRSARMRADIAGSIVNKTRYRKRVRKSVFMFKPFRYFCSDTRSCYFYISRRHFRARARCYSTRT